MKKSLILFIFLLISGIATCVAQSYTFEGVLHNSKGETPVDITIMVETISNGTYRGKSLCVFAKEKNSSDKLFLDFTDNLDGAVTCNYFYGGKTDFLGEFKYRWLFLFQTDYETSNSAIEIGVVYAPSLGKKFNHIRISSFSNKKSTKEWLTAPYSSAVWLAIVNVINKFKETRAYTEWLEIE